VPNLSILVFKEYIGICLIWRDALRRLFSINIILFISFKKNPEKILISAGESILDYLFVICNCSLYHLTFEI